MSPVSQCPFCDVRETSRAELEIHLAIDHPGRVWNDRMPDLIRPAGKPAATAPTEPGDGGDETDRSSEE